MNDKKKINNIYYIIYIKNDTLFYCKSKKYQKS